MRIEYRTGALKAAGLWREPERVAPPPAEATTVDARSNDYLGLAGRGVSRETRGRIGAGASRLISGTWPEHELLEREIAEWLGTEACLVFSSGYAANVGAISGLVGPGEKVLSDALNHASIIDGCRLSRGEVVVLPHRDLEALERALAGSQGVRWVVTESYYGMDGDSPDLVAMRRLCDAHDAALVVDEAHALGVFGVEGRGLCAEQGVVPDVLVGGMGKALGVHGGFVACSRLYRDWLWNRARSLVFSTAPSPLLCELARERVGQVRAADSERAHLRELEERLSTALAGAGLPALPGRHGPLFPIVLGSEAAAMEGAAVARRHGVLCHPVRPPTVPRGQSRLRVTLRADLSQEDVDRIAVALEAAWRSCRSATESSSAPPDSERSAAPSREAPPPTPLSSERIGPVAPSGGKRPTHAHAHAGPVPQRPRDPRPGERRTWVILGTGTGVGKTFVARSLVRLLAERGRPVGGLKPVESGLDIASSASDANALGQLAFRVALPSPHPLYGFPEPLTPARAARTRGVAIDLTRVANWVNATTAADGLPTSLDIVVETAGGVFSPLSDQHDNFHLARVLDPSKWVLVAPNRLGVLHDVTSALRAMSALGRLPDFIVLSAPESPDASAASNHEELARRHATPIIQLPRNQPEALTRLLELAAPF